MTASTTPHCRAGLLSNITSISSIPNLNLSATDDSFRNKFTEEF